MFKLLFAAPLLLASAVTFANPTDAQIESNETELVVRGHHGKHRFKQRGINTTFTLTPVGSTGYELSVTPVSLWNGNFAIASDGTLTLPPGKYVVNFNLNFSNDPATQSSELNMLWTGVGAFQIVDSNNNFIASVLNFEGPTVLKTQNPPLSIKALYDNFGPTTTLVPLNGTVSIRKITK